MFNVTIIRLKDIIKFVIILIIIYIFSQFFIKNISFKESLNKSISINTCDFLKLGINSQSNIIKNVASNYEQNIEDEEIEDENQNISIKSILQIGSNIFKAKEAEKNKKQEKKDSTETIEEVKEVAQTLDVKTDVLSKVITLNPIPETFNKEYNGVKIRNETSIDLTEDILNPNKLNIDTKKVIIFHTHTCESYTESENYKYVSSGNYRTTDLNYSVARVGDELEKYLKILKFEVNHNKNYHDYPSYTGSYTRSLSTVQNILPNFSADIIIDLHRDAIGSDETYAPLVKIGEDECAQLMFVMGTNGGGLSHPNWSSNLQFAIKVQQKANELYPGLFKPIILRNSRYNQHLGKAACIIEVGSTGNTMEQTLASMKYLSKVLEETLN